VIRRIPNLRELRGDSLALIEPARRPVLNASQKATKVGGEIADRVLLRSGRRQSRSGRINSIPCM
jgi:hypothetical protein